MHEGRKKAEIQAAAKKRALSSSSENVEKTTRTPTKKPHEHHIRKAEITYGENFLVVPDDTTIDLMRKMKSLNDQVVKEAKMNKVDPPTPGTDIIMWMACSGTERERKPFLVMAIPTLLESNVALSKLLQDKHNSIVIDKVEFKRNDQKLLAPRAEFHVKNDLTHLETHYECKFTKTAVQVRVNPLIPTKELPPLKERASKDIKK